MQVVRLEWAAEDEIASLALGVEDVEREGGRSLFMDSVSMQDVEERVRMLDLSVRTLVAQALMHW